MTDYTDELFALRLALQDTIFDETRIIKELKMFLIEKNVPNDSINQTIQEFYKKYGIDFTDEFIASVTVPAIFQVPANNNVPLNPFQFISQFNNINNSLNENNSNNNEGTNDDTGDESDEDDEDEDEEYSGEIDVSPLLLPIPPNLPPHPQMNHAMSQLFGINPEAIPLTSPQVQLINTLNQLLSLGNMNPEEMEDVKATLDDSDMDSLEIKTATEDTDTTCSVCMTKIVKDNKYMDLPCEHTFHESCISTWLKEYNYKCPICRKECGKPKYDI